MFDPTAARTMWGAVISPILVVFSAFLYHEPSIAHGKNDK
jgi:hypothetical protein